MAATIDEAQLAKDAQLYDDARAWEAEQAAQDVAPVERETDPFGGLWKEAKRVGYGAYDTTATVATQAAASAGGGLTGLATLAATRDPGMAAAATEKVQSIAREPHSKEARNILGTVEKVATPIFTWLGDKYEGVARFLLTPDAAINTEGQPTQAPSPEAVAGTATAIKTAFEGWPLIKQLRSMNIVDRVIARRTYEGTKSAMIIKMAKDAERLGIRFTNDDIRQSVIIAAEKKAGKGPGDPGMSTLADKVQEALAKARVERDRVFTAARQGDTGVAFGPVRKLAEDFRAWLYDNQYALDKMPEIEAQLKALERLDTTIPGRLPADAARAGTKPSVVLGADGKPMVAAAPLTDVPLRDLDHIAQNVTSHLPTDRRTIKVANELRDRLTAHVEGLFDRDALSGDPAVWAKWKDAHALQKLIHDNFDVDRTIQRLVTEDATPEQIAQWLKGASAMNAPKQAAATITRLKNILGADADTVLQPVRDAVIYDAVAPLVTGTPGTTQFTQVVRNIERLTTRNPTLLKALGIDGQDLTLLRRGAYAARLAADAPTPFSKAGFISFVVRHMVGSGLAIKGARVRFLDRIAQNALQGQAMGEAALRNEFVSLDLNKPIIPRGNPHWYLINALGQAANEARVLGDPTVNDDEDGANP